jgi:trehalose 6-phosphate phosphatase
MGIGTVMVTAPLRPEIPRILDRLCAADRVVLALDFDGTLAPIVDRPDQAALPDETGRILRELASVQKLCLAILSGRTIPDLRSRIGLDCIFAGNHGLEISGGGISFVHDRAAGLQQAVELACGDLAMAHEGVPNVLIENKALTATVHYRRAYGELEGWIEATTRMVLEPYGRWLRVRPARKAWEICPRVNWNKGSALNMIVDYVGPESLVICAGDDDTDESMFRTSPDCISIQVGGRFPTAGRYTVAGPTELASFLEMLLPAVQLRKAG